MAIQEHLTATVTVGGTAQKYYFLGTAENYAGGIAAAVGVAVSLDADKSKPVTPVENLQGAGYLFRITCNLNDNRRREVLCTRDKLATALDDLPGLTIDGALIDTAIISRKAVFF